MRKTDKKIDNQLREVLTDICEQTLKTYDGFLWVTHVVNFSNFPQSLKIVCVFDTNEQLETFVATQGKAEVQRVMHKALMQAGIKLKSIEKHLTFDTQENCERDHRGKWDARFG